MDSKRQKTAFVESIIDTLAQDIVALSINPTRYCALYVRPATRNAIFDNLWVSCAIFSKNEPGMPPNLTAVRMPKGGEGWEEHRPMFLTHAEAARYVRLVQTQCVDFAFVFASEIDSFDALMTHEEIIAHERVEVVTGKYLVDSSDGAITGQQTEEEYLDDNVLAFQEQIVPAIARMLGRFYPSRNSFGYYVNSAS
jgi:hypothetical protein